MRQRPLHPFDGASSLAVRRFIYDPPPTRNKKHKTAAKERRRIVRQKKADAAKSPAERGEEIPPFFIPARYKLLTKFYEQHKNSRRLQRKPIPKDVQDDFAGKAKAFA